MKYWDLTCFMKSVVCVLFVQLDIKSHLSLVFEIDAITLFEGSFLGTLQSTTCNWFRCFCLNTIQPLGRSDVSTPV